MFFQMYFHSRNQSNFRVLVASEFPNEDPIHFIRKKSRSVMFPQSIFMTHFQAVSFLFRCARLEFQNFQRSPLHVQITKPNRTRTRKAVVKIPRLPPPRRQFHRTPNPDHFIRLFTVLSRYVESLSPAPLKTDRVVRIH